MPSIAGESDAGAVMSPRASSTPSPRRGETSRAGGETGGGARLGDRGGAQDGAGAVPAAGGGRDLDLAHPSRPLHRPGVRAQPLGDGAIGAGHGHALRRAVHPRPGNRPQAAERALARRRLRQADAAHQGVHTGDPADHGERAPGPADTVLRPVLRPRYPRLAAAVPAAAGAHPRLPGGRARGPDRRTAPLPVAGTPEEAREKLAAYADLADSICLAPPDQLIDPAETEEYRRALLATFGR